MSNANEASEEREETHMETPFNMMIVGMTGCGKTYYLLDMLVKEYFGHFDYIFLICPTYNWNKTYQEWIYKDGEKFYPIPCDQNSVDDFTKYIVDNFKGTNSLIILTTVPRHKLLRTVLVNWYHSECMQGISDLVLLLLHNNLQVSQNHSERI